MKLEDIKVVGVYGAGLMGSGIAQVMAQHGYQVLIRDIKPELVETGLAAVRASLDKAAAKCIVTAEQARQAFSLIKGTTDIEQVAREADFMVEAITEKVDFKKDLYQKIGAVGKPDAIIATNTSTLSITELASGAKRPENFIGMHFFNPAPIMKLVEMIRGLLTSDETTDTTRRLAIKVGKDPIIANDAPGFATSRIGLSAYLEASRMLQEGIASVADIDKGMRLGYGHRMGPFETCDLVGLDARLNNLNAMYQATGNPIWAPPQLLKKLVTAGFLGKKPGSRGGYYKYFGLEEGK